MSRTSDPVELIRRSNPVPDPNQLPGPDSPAAQAMLAKITDVSHEDTAPSPRRYRRRTTLIAAALFVLTGAAAAVAAGVFSPDPADVEAVLEESADAAAVHLEGWRPELSTESVWCMYGPSEGAATTASGYALDLPMTIDLLIQECATDNDVARNQPNTPTVFTLCEATFTDDVYSFKLASSGETILAGDLDAARPGFPVVLAWETDCETTQLETSWDVELQPLAGLDDVNVARQIEIELKAESARRCVPRDEADALAAQARQRLGDSWLLVERPLEEAPPGEVQPDVFCYEVYLNARWGMIAVRGDDTPPVTAPVGE
jgi:hypothetical protein